MITLKHLQKTIGGATILDVDRLEVGAGEIVGIGGVIGDEQRLLLGLLTGKIRPTAGNIEIAGMNPAAHPEATGARIGVLFAENALYERHTARANLEFYCRLLGLPLVRADQVLALVGLADHAGVAAGKLPSGLARRLALGRAILPQPAVLLLVEPFAGCDPASIDVISRLIRQAADEQVAVLILAAEAVRLTLLCQKVILLEQGRVVQRYNPAESNRATDLPFKIPARLEGKVVLVNPAEIGYVSAEEGRTALHLADGQM